MKSGTGPFPNAVVPFENLRWPLLDYWPGLKNTFRGDSGDLRHR
jgi:hypothetical protein